MEQPDNDWTELDAAGRTEYVQRQIKAGNWLSVIRPGTDDSTLDALAALRAVIDDDMPALAVLLIHGDTGSMLIATLKMLAEICVEQKIDPAYMSVWATHVMVRKST